MDEKWIVDAAGLELEDPAKYLVELAERKAQRFGQKVRFAHLLLAVLDRHLKMAEEMVGDIDWHAVRVDLEPSLKAGKEIFVGEVADALRRAGEAARAEESETVKLSHLVRAVVEMAAEMLGAPPVAEAAGEASEEEKEAGEGKAPAEPGEAGAEARAAEGEEGSALRASVPQQYRKRVGRPTDTPFLDRVGVDLTEQAREGKLPPVVGRDREIESLIAVLCRRYKRNPLLIGPAGVGKTAIVEGLAQRIAEGRVPEPLQGARIIQVAPTALLRSLGIDGSNEEQLRQLIEEASQQGVILFIDEIHRIVGAGGLPGLHDLGQRLKPALARGQIACIGATTEEEYRQYIQDDRALDRRFQPLRIKELGADATKQIVSTLAEQWTRGTNVRVPEEAIEQVVELADQYMPMRRFPDKAITLLDTVLSRAAVDSIEEVSEALIRDTVHELVGSLPEDELARRLEGLEDYLNSQVYGQQEAAALVAGVLRVTMRGLDAEPQRPNGVLVFAGPPSVGKRTMARAIAQWLFDAPDRVLEIEMVRYQHEHCLYDLIGSPPGFVGFERGGVLDWINDVRAGVIVLDNPQVADPRVMAIFEEIFDVGVITNMRGEELYFSDAIFVITCDIATERKHVGFAPLQEDPSIERQVHQLLSGALLDRVDAICPFYPLDEQTVRRVVQDKLLPVLVERARDRGIKLEIADEAVAVIAEQAYSRERGLQRATKIVQRLVMNPVLDVIGTEDTSQEPVGVELRVKDGRLIAVRKSKEGD